MEKEIERRFLVKDIPPEIHSAQKTEIRQGYLQREPLEVRIREEGNQFTLTEKKGTGQVRDEHNETISEEEFLSLWPEINGAVEKTRRKIKRGKRILEIDIYHGAHEGLVKVEVELESPNARFIPPDWFGQEITEDQSYSNAQLALTPPRHWSGAKFPYPLEEGVQRLIQATHARLTHHDRVLVYVAGGSASGKTSRVADAVINAFDDSTILSLDHYYRGGAWMDEQRAQGKDYNFDQPEVLELELVTEHLAQLLQGMRIQRPVYTFEQGGTRVGYKPMDSAQVIVVEGLFALRDDINHDPCIKAFVDIDVHGALIRRVLRDVQRTDWTPSQILQYFADVVVPMDEQYVQSTKRNADITIGNPYNPATEARRSGQHEYQIKFRGELREHIMHELGAEFIAHTHQTDTYLDPHDRNLAQTGESLRIREQDGPLLLTYKGPRERAQHRKRPKFECIIDDALRQSLLSIYGKEYKIIEKDRSVYLLDGAAISADHVVRNEEPLGPFVEIRATDEAHMKRLITTLGYDEKDKITTSYAEM